LHIGRGDAIGVGLFERCLVGGQGGQVLHHGFPVAAHFHRADDHLLDLRFQGIHPAIPELFEVQAGVEYRRRIDFHGLAVETQGEGFRVGAPGFEVMAAGTGQCVVDRQARLIEQLAPQLDLGRGELGQRRHGFERFVQRRGRHGHPQAQPQREDEAETVG